MYMYMQMNIVFHLLGQRFWYHWWKHLYSDLFVAFSVMSSLYVFIRKYLVTATVSDLHVLYIVCWMLIAKTAKTREELKLCKMQSKVEWSLAIYHVIQKQISVYRSPTPQEIENEIYKFPEERSQWCTFVFYN